MNTGIKYVGSLEDVLQKLFPNVNYTSSKNALKILKIGTGGMSTAGDISIYTHGLGYEPQFRFFSYTQDEVGNNSEYYEVPYATVANRSARGFPTAFNNYIPYATATELRYSVNNISGGFVLNYAYVVYYDPA